MRELTSQEYLWGYLTRITSSPDTTPRRFPSYFLLHLSYISFSSFLFLCALYRIFLLFLPWLPCHFYLDVIQKGSRKQFPFDNWYEPNSISIVFQFHLYGIEIQGDNLPRWYFHYQRISKKVSRRISFQSLQLVCVHLSILRYIIAYNENVQLNMRDTLALFTVQNLSCL